jgi:hypothetical protein
MILGTPKFIFKIDYIIDGHPSIESIGYKYYLSFMLKKNRPIMTHTFHMLIKFLLESLTKNTYKIMHFYILLIYLF